MISHVKSSPALSKFLISSIWVVWATFLAISKEAVDLKVWILNTIQTHKSIFHTSASNFVHCFI